MAALRLSGGQGGRVPPDVRAAFTRFEKPPGSGKLGHRELRDGLQALGLEVSSLQQAQPLLARYDAAPSGSMDLDEFSQLVAHLPSNP